MNEWFEWMAAPCNYFPNDMEEFPSHAPPCVYSELIYFDNDDCVARARAQRRHQRSFERRRYPLQRENRSEAISLRYISHSISLLVIVCLIGDSAREVIPQKVHKEKQN